MRMRATGIVSGALVIYSLTDASAGQNLLTEPDYTKGETTKARYEGKPDWNYSALGSIGAIATVWGARGAKPTDKTRMFQIRSVMAGAPADGVLQEGDVILGIGSKKFSSDARKALADAIIEAQAKDGKLTLLIWRPSKVMDEAGTLTGNEMPATLKLPVTGKYSDTSPWECAKTKAIIDAACKNILERGIYETKRDVKRIRGGIPTRLEVLGLLATGEEKYLPIIKEYVRELSDSKKEDEGGFHSWSIAYEMLLITEYYLATKDEYVLPAIENTAKRIANGASDVGTFSHGSAYSFTAHGKEWKYPCSYGAMNQCSITCAMALVLAQKCGVKDSEVDAVVQKALNFYRWYVDKGAIPYGDHGPGRNHDNNGVNSQAAVLFDLAGEKDTADYFTRNALASYNIREQGHTGHFFSFQWGALGAARGGDEAAQSFVRNMRWYTELERRPDGGYMYQPQLGGSDHGKYTKWSTTGSRLLQHCLPRKQLYITGKGGSCIRPIKGDELKEVVAAGEFDGAQLTVKELLEALGSWSPIVRRKAAEELGEREDDVVKEMITMLDSPSRYARYGATQGLSYAGRGSEAAIDALVKKLESDDDLTMRYYAACAFRKKRIWQGPPIKSWKILENTLAKEGGAIDKAIPALLKQAAKSEPKVDPLRKLHNVIASTLFYGGGAQSFTGCLPKGAGIDKLDRDLFIPAVRSLLINPNGGARTSVSCVFPKLTEDDLKKLWGDIYYAVKYQAPSGSMSAGGVRGNGLKLMADKGIEEGLTLGIDWALRQEGWGNSARKKNGIPSLLKYGKALEPYQPEIEEVLAGWTKEKKSKNDQKAAEEFKKQMAEALKKPAPKLKSIKSYVDASSDPLIAKQKK